MAENKIYWLVCNDLSGNRTIDKIYDTLEAAEEAKLLHILQGYECRCIETFRSIVELTRHGG
jgi:hypothetical protein